MNRPILPLMGPPFCARGGRWSRCGCVAVSANDPGTSANPDAECPKARCALAMDPGTYTVGSWGKTNYDGRGYRSFNNNAN